MKKYAKRFIKNIQSKKTEKPDKIFSGGQDTLSLKHNSRYILLLLFVLFSFAEQVKAQSCGISPDGSSATNVNEFEEDIIMGAYHAHIQKTNGTYAVTGAKFTPNGTGNQNFLTLIDQATYGLTAGVSLVAAAIGNESIDDTQGIFLGDDNNIYAIGNQGKVIASGATSSNSFSASSLSLPSGISTSNIKKFTGGLGNHSNYLINTKHI